MILRYSVETKHSRAFTASKNVVDELQAIAEVVKLKKANLKAAYAKYSDFTLYDDNNIIISMENKSNKIFTPDQPIRALSWKQPFAELMNYGKIETRTWKTNYRGWVLICASKKAYDFRELYLISGSKQMDRIVKLLGRNYDHWLKNIAKTHGKAIAIGYLADCRPMLKSDEDACFVAYYPDLWCHVYEDVQAIEHFDWKGSQGWKILNDDIKNLIILK